MTKKYDQRAYVVEKEEFLKTIVTNTNDCIQIPHSISLTKDGFYDVETECSETLELIKAVLEPKFDGITFERYSKTLQKFMFKGGVNKPCPSHPDVTHKSFEGLVSIEDRHIRMKCWTNNRACGGSVFKIEIPKESLKSTNEVRRVKRACEREVELFDFDEDLGEFNAINLEMKYIETEFHDFYFGSQIFIKSPMGTGKTQLVSQWIQRHFSDK